MKRQIDLIDARGVASWLESEWGEHCKRFDIAGSIRRGNSAVSDIEIVCEPLVVPSDIDLFGEAHDEEVPLFDYIMLQRQEGILRDRLDVNGRPRDGDRHKELLLTPPLRLFRPGMPAEIPVDVFCVRPPAQYGAILAIRTGPADFSRWLVTQRRFGGGMPNGWRLKDGRVLDDRGETVPTDTEEDFFEALGVPWLEPIERGCWQSNMRRRSEVVDA